MIAIFPFLLRRVDPGQRPPGGGRRRCLVLPRADDPRRDASIIDLGCPGKGRAIPIDTEDHR